MKSYKIQSRSRNASKDVYRDEQETPGSCRRLKYKVWSSLLSSSGCSDCICWIYHHSSVFKALAWFWKYSGHQTVFLVHWSFMHNEQFLLYRSYKVAVCPSSMKQQSDRVTGSHLSAGRPRSSDRSGSPGRKRKRNKTSSSAGTSLL